MLPSKLVNFTYKLIYCYKILSHCSDDVICALIQTYCTNMYCCLLWFDSTESGITKLSRSYNSVLRRLLFIYKPYRLE